MDGLLIYKFFNSLYKKNFSLYKLIYFLYKRLSDKGKINFLKDKIKSGMTVLDIGGNVGFYTILLSRLVGSEGHVHVFEPDLLNFKYLKLNTGNLKNVILNNTAVGQESGKIRLYISDDLNVDHQTYDSGESRKFIEVEALKIDDYFKNNEIIDFIKIDIQGYDYFAIQGMRETLKRSHKVIIFGEFWPYGLNNAGINPYDYLALLKELGFRIQFLEPGKDYDYNVKINDKTFYTDFYAVRCNSDKSYK